MQEIYQTICHITLVRREIVASERSAFFLKKKFRGIQGGAIGGCPREQIGSHAQVDCFINRKYLTMRGLARIELIVIRMLLHIYIYTHINRTQFFAMNAFTEHRHYTEILNS